LNASYSKSSSEYAQAEIGSVSGGDFIFYLNSIPVATAYSTAYFFDEIYAERHDDTINWKKVRFKIEVYPDTSKIIVANIVLDDPGSSYNGYRLVSGNETGSHSSVYIYSDSGNQERQTVKITFSGANADESVFYEESYDLSLSRGWQLVYVEDTYNDSTKTHKKTFSNKTKPADSRWYLVEPPAGWYE
jgi:hypothetical protein